MNFMPWNCKCCQLTKETSHIPADSKSGWHRKTDKYRLGGGTDSPLVQQFGLYTGTEGHSSVVDRYSPGGGINSTLERSFGLKKVRMSDRWSLADRDWLSIKLWRTSITEVATVREWLTEEGSLLESGWQGKDDRVEFDANIWSTVTANLIDNISNEIYDRKLLSVVSWLKSLNKFHQTKRMADREKRQRTKKLTKKLTKLDLILTHDQLSTELIIFQRKLRPEMVEGKIDIRLVHWHIGSQLCSWYRQVQNMAGKQVVQIVNLYR